MGAIAEALVSKGVRITGSDRTYPYGDKKEHLRALGVEVNIGFDALHLNPPPDLVIIGRGFTRGNPEVEAVLEQRIPYLSMPAFLGFYFLNGTRNILVAGSKGKTTTAGLLVHLLSQAGLNPGYLIGGSPRSGMPPARLAGSMYVLEADEYSSLWWDGNAKFLHYRPEVLILTNIYRDHPDLHQNHEASLSQYRSLISQLPRTGLLIVADSAGSRGMRQLLDEVPCPVKLLDDMEATSEQAWDLVQAPGSRKFRWRDVEFELRIPGKMNARNACCAVLAAEHLGLSCYEAAKALQGFEGVHGRLELVRQSSHLDIYVDGFGYLPQSLACNHDTLQGLRPNRQLILVYNVILVDRMPSTRQMLLDVLSRWDKVLIVVDAPVASITPQAHGSFVAELVDELTKRNLHVAGPLSLTDVHERLRDLLIEDAVVLFSVHPSFEAAATQIGLSLPEP